MELAKGSVSALQAGASGPSPAWVDEPTWPETRLPGASWRARGRSGDDHLLSLFLPQLPPLPSQCLVPPGAVVPPNPLALNLAITDRLPCSPRRCYLKPGLGNGSPTVLGAHSVFPSA